MKPTTETIVGLVLAALLAAPALAISEQRTGPPPPKGSPVISPEAATRIALATAPGTVKSFECERQRSRWIYSFEVATEDGEVVDVEVDGTSGEVLDQATGGEALPPYLSDRGTGIPTSMFATYVRRHELVVYPFFEYYHDNDSEYKPSELGFGLDQDFKGRYRASEGLLFLAYGLTDSIALEFEVAAIRATLQKSPEDPSAMPPKLSESGLGDVQTQLTWVLAKESDHRPEVFSFLEVVFPHHKDKVLIGTSDWEFKLGAGIIKGLAWGTIIGRVAVEHLREERKTDLGEWAIEYLKQVSQRWRLYAGIEGTQDEVSLIAEAQYRLSRDVSIKLNSGFGLTPKATDWAPEIGILFSFPKL